MYKNCPKCHNTSFTERYSIKKNQKIKLCSKCRTILSKPEKILEGHVCKKNDRLNLDVSERLIMYMKKNKHNLRSK